MNNELDGEWTITFRRLRWWNLLHPRYWRTLVRVWGWQRFERAMLRDKT